MGRKIKKGVKGEASQYLTRSNAIRALQVSFKDFRKLCILKGIYPRMPNKKFKGNDKTYFHVKDLKILQHDQLLEKFRSIKAHLKKHKKYLGRREVKTAEDHLKKTPKLSLVSVIKDRYPTFVDALRDLDDALCLISLYAQLPQHVTLEVSRREIQTCTQLYRDFMLYCTVSQVFNKAFFSIKGIYYRVEIMGQPITWVQPYKFNQRLPFDVDYKIMGTFTEFYMALLKFVNFKLFSDLGLPYPMPQADLPMTGELFKSDEIREMQTNARKLFDQGAEQDDGVVDDEFQDTPEIRAMKQRLEAAKSQRKLLSKFVFLLGRETPIYILQNLILSFGGDYVCQDDLPDDEKEAAKVMKRITHICMDRPVPASSQDKSKEYVQPQYIVDSINNLFLLPTKPYAPGTPAPAHLSPFVDNETEGYLPDRQREINALAGIESTLTGPALGSDTEEDENDDQDKEDSDVPVEKTKTKAKGDVDSSSDEEGASEELSDSESEDVAPAVKGKKGAKASAAVAKKPTPKTAKKIQKQVLTRADRAAKNDKIKRDLAKEQQEMGKMLMSNRQKKMYQEVEKTQKTKKEAAKKLVQKKRNLDKAKSSAGKKK